MDIEIMIGITLLFTHVWYFAAFVYEGCFVDNSDRIFDTRLSDSDTNTPSECFNRCTLAGYVYAGVEVS